MNFLSSSAKIASELIKFVSPFLTGRFAKMLSLLRLLRLSRLVRYVSQWEEVYVS